MKEAQIDEGENKSKDDLEYGGLGYQPGTRPDLSNTQMALDVLNLAGVPSTDPVFQKATVFVSRMQNLASAHNTQPWADKFNDGSFIYVLSAGRGAVTPPDAPRPGYGSMTYSGLKCFAQAGLTESDPRMAAGLKWLAKNYSVDINPGRQAGGGGEGHYYYLMVMAKSLSAMKVDEFVDADGKKHDWRADITRALTARQGADGKLGEFVPELAGNERRSLHRVWLNHSVLHKTSHQVGPSARGRFAGNRKCRSASRAALGWLGDPFGVAIQCQRP